MKSTALLAAFLRMTLVGRALFMAQLTEVPRFTIPLLGLLGCTLLLPELIPASLRERSWKWAAGITWCCTLLLIASLFLTGSKLTFLHTYFALLTWLIATAMALTVHRAATRGVRRSWKVLAITWACLGEFIWLGDAYTQNRAGDFYIGIVFGVLLLVLIKTCFQMPAFAHLTANTLILIFVFLPIADLFLRPSEQQGPQPNVAGDGYLYATAKKDPDAFRKYWARYLAQYDRLMRDIFISDPTGLLPYRVRTNSRTSFFQSHIQINSLGFRGKEIAPQKNGTYRIVALGESNTFGFTLNPDHKPWPEFLEEMIDQQLKPQRPVEVINAGLPHHSLEANLHRLRNDILALKPDMIISYHGWNGFPWLYSSLPPVFVRHLPDYKRRPLRLLANCEYRLRLLAFKHSLRADPLLQLPSLDRLMETRYATAYRNLIEIAHTNHIRLVLANYSMAVNSASDPDIIEFYREAFPAIYPTIQVNVIHSRLVEELARQNPAICFVDTHPHLDGQHDHFIDLVHFAPDGDRQLAGTFFNAITNILLQDLAAPNSESSSHSPQ